MLVVATGRPSRCDLRNRDSGDFAGSPVGLIVQGLGRGVQSVVLQPQSLLPIVVDVIEAPR